MKSFEEGGFRRGSIAPSQQISGRIRNKTGGGGTGSDMRLRSNSLSEHSPEKSKMRHPTAAPATSSNLQPLSGSEEVNLVPDFTPTLVYLLDIRMEWNDSIG